MTIAIDIDLLDRVNDALHRAMTLASLYEPSSHKYFLEIADEFDNALFLESEVEEA